MYTLDLLCVTYKDTDPTWLLQDATFEKMGALMAENGGRQLGMFDELSAFLIKIKLYSSRGLTASHELAMFLELHNANPWTRTTGTCTYKYLCIPMYTLVQSTSMNPAYFVQAPLQSTG